jgi:uncharacterized repeat protein (TIGR01451 family)
LYRQSPLSVLVGYGIKTEKQEEQMRGKYCNRLLAMSFYLACSVLLAFGFSGTAAAITFTNISGPGGTCNSGIPPGYCNDVGIDYSQLTGNLVNSLFPNAGQAGPGGLFNVDRITGVHTLVANAPAGSVIDETKVATVRVAGPACNANQSFPVGTIFTGNGLPGQIVIIPPSGPSTTLLLQGTSVTLSGTIMEDAVLRGGFFQDRFCAAGGDLFVVSGSGTPGAPVGGNVWRVHPTGTGTFTITHIVRIPNTAGTAGTRAHLEGVIVVPNDALIYGPWAGKIVTGDEDRTDVGSPVTAIINGTNPKIYAVDPTTGSVLSNGSGFTITGPVPHPEDFDFIEGDFYGNAYNNNGSDTTGSPKGAILRASFLDFDLTKGDILITQEYPQTPGDNSQISITRCVDVGANSGLYQFRWNGTSFVSTLLARSGTSPVLCQWEHVTFVPVSNITIEKTPDGNSFNIGDQIFFTIKVTSTGPGTATNVILNDPLPTPGNLNTWFVQSDPSGTCAVSSNVLTCNFGTLVAGQTRTVTVATNTTGGANSAACTTNNGRVNNTATVTADGPLSAQDTGFWICTPPLPPQIKCEEGIRDFFLRNVLIPGSPLITVTNKDSRNSSEIIWAQGLVPLNTDLTIFPAQPTDLHIDARTPIQGKVDKKLGSFVYIYLGNSATPVTKIHTACSQPTGPGLMTPAPGFMPTPSSPGGSRPFLVTDAFLVDGTEMGATDPTVQDKHFPGKGDGIPVPQSVTDQVRAGGGL